jgi:hypothetical protein
VKQALNSEYAHTYQSTIQKLHNTVDTTVGEYAGSQKYLALNTNQE